VLLPSTQFEDLVGLQEEILFVFCSLDAEVDLVSCVLFFFVRYLPVESGLSGVINPFSLLGHRGPCAPYFLLSPIGPRLFFYADPVPHCIAGL